MNHLRTLCLLALFTVAQSAKSANPTDNNYTAGFPCHSGCTDEDAKRLQVAFESSATRSNQREKMRQIISKNTSSERTYWSAAAREYFSWREDDERNGDYWPASTTRYVSQETRSQPQDSPQRVVQAQNISTETGQQSCIRYGFKSGTTAFAQCQMQIEQANQQSLFEQQQYEMQVAQYQRQMAAYQAQQEAIREEKSRRRWEALARLGAGMANSQSPSFLGALNEGLAAANGVPIAQPVAPSVPRPRTHTLVLPNGAVITCRTTGRITNCF